MSLFNKPDLDVKYDVLSRNLTKSINGILLEDSNNFSQQRSYDIFLSHSSLDAKYILALRETIKTMGYSVYVDWIEDPEMNRNRVTKETAHKLQIRMKTCKSLFFATTSNSSGSKWMPWELGYFDGIKGKVAILPVFDYANVYNAFIGQEYLGLYPYVGVEKANGKDSLWIFKDRFDSVSFNEWSNFGISKGMFI